MTDQELTQIVDSLEALDSRIKKMEKNLSSDSEVARERRAAQRERRLLADERLASESTSAAAAEQMMSIKTSLEEQIAAATAAMETKSQSARSGQLLMQDMRNGLETELLEAREEVSKLRVANTEAQVEIQNLMTSLGEYKDRLNLTDEKVKKSVLGAAELAVRELNDKRISEEVARQMRIFMRAQQEQAD